MVKYRKLLLLTALLFTAPLAFNWLRSYFHPLVLTPSAEAIGLTTARFSTSVAAGDELPGTWHDASGQPEGPEGHRTPREYVVCLQRSKPSDTNLDRRLESLSLFFYFRSLSRWWDLRARVLDVSARRSALLRWKAPFYGIETAFDVRLFEFSLAEELGRNQRVRGEAAARRIFRIFDDCSDFKSENSRATVIRVIAVSPMVESPYGLWPWVQKALGYFCAFEVERPGGSTERYVVYAGGHVLEARCPNETREFLSRIYWVEEKYWERDFGRWPKLWAMPDFKKHCLCEEDE